MPTEAGADDPHARGAGGVEVIDRGADVSDRLVSTELIEQREPLRSPGLVVWQLGSGVDAMVEVGRQRNEPVAGEAFADIANVRGEAEQLVRDDDAGGGRVVAGAGVVGVHRPAVSDGQLHALREHIGAGKAHFEALSVWGAANEKRSPAHASRGAAASSRARTLGESTSSAAATFSASRLRRLVPGIGTTSSP